MDYHFRAVWRDYRTKNIHILQRRGGDLQSIFLCLAIISMFAPHGKLMFENYALFARLFVPLALFFMPDFCLALFVGKRLKMPFTDRNSLLFYHISARRKPDTEDKPFLKPADSECGVDLTQAISTKEQF